MPAKPKDLINRHDTKAEKEHRESAERALTPSEKLSRRPPAILNGPDHQMARAVWRRLIDVYNELEARIVSTLDFDLLIDYCILSEQVAELDRARESARDVWHAARTYYTFLITSDPENHTAAYEAALKVAETLNNFVKIDGRADRKRDLLFKLRQNLYLTPRARAGFTPKVKADEPPADPLDLLLNEFIEHCEK